MTRAILFDMGGTLDGEGQHWLDRFSALYRDAGIQLSRDALRAAFDTAEAHAATDEEIAAAGIDAMVARHVSWQLEYLGIRDTSVREALIQAFIAPIRTSVAANRPILKALADRGFLLGIVSNGCGNVDVLCRDYGFSPFLSAVVDSRRVGLSKPDPRIFEKGASLLGVPPALTLVVGDSFERDIVPARRAGMRTAWLQPNPAVVAPDPSAVDIRLRRVGDLLTVLPDSAPAGLLDSGLTRNAS